MANIHEITRNLIEFRGEVKAAQIKAGTIEKTVEVGHGAKKVQSLLDDLQKIDFDNFTGCIWFTSGSYAYLDKDGAGYYWCFVQVPEIPEELKK